MTREQAEQIAQAAMDRFMGKGGFRIKPWVIDAIMEAVAVEREECAKACEDEAVDADATNEQTDSAYNTALSHAAKAIRARGER